ncbi:fatty acyl-AMP ligase [Solihabitans fulvus]|uniref:Fatty acyl-AMP ligase n=1 Tax=Solihabitans fulvus TaxID=1892852 RepID=A0A5B2WND7_9PSEU|nr:fatty acyl-AMP ligase [Solihabitans fulvus]KAA2252915.1 fatty acyl-AMP ligase [Solihabitans fulvus]
MSRFVDTMLATAAGAGGEASGMTTGEPATPTRRTWAQVHEQATRMAGALVSGGVSAGGSVAVLAGDPASIAPAVQAVWLAGASVTMLHQPTARTDLADWAQDTLRVLSMIDAKLVLLGTPFDALASVLDEHDVAYRTLDELTDGTPLAAPVEVPEESTALLQLTSGSTAEPKAVRITHGNLMANALAMKEAAALQPGRDVMVSWLPLFHDMGMVGFLTVPMLFGIELVKVTPVDFLRSPVLWPELISRHRGTITAAPNFAYAIVGRRMSTVDDDGAYDLSTLRIALNGAEPIDPAAVASFTEAGARFKLPPECVLAAYGMAEATLAVAFAPLFTGLSVDVIDAEALAGEHRAVPVTEDGDRQVRSFPLLGPPLPGIEVQTVDGSGRVLGDREVGQLRLRGAAVTPEYLTVRGPVSTQDADGWLDTGDEGYTVDGQVVVCGRIKDVIIMGGRNIYPTDIERAAMSVDGVRAGNAVAVRLDAGTRRERFAVACESRLAGDEDAEKALRKEITARVVDAVGLRPFAVVVLPPGSLPKTPSGKLRRAAAASLVGTE